MIQIIVLLLCQFLLILLAGYIVYSWLTKTPYYPSSTKQLDDLIDELKVDFNGDRFLDIGSGDGRFVIWAAKRGFRADGIEFNPFLTLWSRFKAFFTKNRKNIKILNKNFNNHNFSEYNFVYVYIFERHMQDIQKKLFSELKPGSVIISRTFEFKDVIADKKFNDFFVYFIK